MKRKLVLSGFMGTGKSSVGARVAALVDERFVDLDEVIVRESGRSIPDIFADDGETGFRALEKRALVATLAEQGAFVVAVGGGALIDNASRALAKEAGFVVTLTAEPGTILRRTEQSDRPLLVGADPRGAVSRLLKQRASAYVDCHLRLATDERSLDELAAAILSSWSDFAR